MEMENAQLIQKIPAYPYQVKLMLTGITGHYLFMIFLVCFLIFKFIFEKFIINIILDQETQTFSYRTHCYIYILCLSSILITISLQGKVILSVILLRFFLVPFLKYFFSALQDDLKKFIAKKNESSPEIKISVFFFITSQNLPILSNWVEKLHLNKLTSHDTKILYNEWDEIKTSEMRIKNLKFLNQNLIKYDANLATVLQEEWKNEFKTDIFRSSAEMQVRSQLPVRIMDYKLAFDLNGTPRA